MADNRARASSQEARQTAVHTAPTAQDFEALFLEHWPRVYRVLARLLGDHAEAEDVALEAFWRLYERAPHAGRELNVGAWLHRVATNLGLNAIRAWKRRAQYESEAARAEFLARAEGDPAQAAAEAEARQRVQVILGEMEARQAQVLVLRHSGLSYREVAAALGVAAGSVGTLLARAEREFERRYRARHAQEG